MSLDKSISSGREHREKYRKVCYIVDRSCRNHGGRTKRHCAGQCTWCLENRTHRYTKEVERGKASIEDYEAENFET